MQPVAAALICDQQTSGVFVIDLIAAALLIAPGDSLLRHDSLVNFATTKRNVRAEFATAHCCRRFNRQFWRHERRLNWRQNVHVGQSRRTDEVCSISDRAFIAERRITAHPGHDAVVQMHSNPKLKVKNDQAFQISCTDGDYCADPTRGHVADATG